MPTTARHARPSPVPAVRRHKVARTCVVEAVESRILFHLEVQQPIPDQEVAVSAPATDIDLFNRIFNELTDPTVRFTTVAGNFDVQLTRQQTPITVNNFLNYVRSGRYNDTVVHRSADLSGGVPFVIQGRGFRWDTSGGTPVGVGIQTDPPIQNEFSPARPNNRGTIAMAKTSDPNSATSQWFINLSDNAFLNDPANSGGFTTFGSVVGNGM